MVKRLKVWSYLAVALGATLFDGGCSWGSGWLYGGSLDSWPRIITAILREDIFG